MCQLVILYLLSLTSSAAWALADSSPLNRALGALALNLNYIHDNHHKINVDCLFGVVLAKAFLEDALADAGPYQAQIAALGARAGAIYSLTLPLLKNTKNWQFTHSLIVPSLWARKLEFRVKKLQAKPTKWRVDALFSADAYANYTENFSDGCLAEIVAETEFLEAQACRLSRKCVDFVEGRGKNVGYMTTHRLILIQVARARHCTFEKAVLDAYIEDICGAVYAEAVSVEYHGRLGEVFDLFMEGVTLCGMEGFRAFFKATWLEYVLGMELASGCFPAELGDDESFELMEEKKKREANVMNKEGCTDHSTGLGAAFLALYVNFLAKEQLNFAVLLE